MKPGFVLVTFLQAKAFAQSDAQKSCGRLQALAGFWEGTITTSPLTPEVPGKPIQVTLRTTFTGNALRHEGKIAGRQDDPIMMLHLDGDRLLLTRCCDSGNRPRMAAKTSPDGKSVEFDFLDVAGSTQYGDTHQGVFTFVDANHHIEDWTFMETGDRPVHAHFDFERGNAK